jgi:predicted transcriptional regulator
VVIAAARSYITVMDTLKQDIGTTSGTETEAERQARLAWEADMIAEARDDVAAGRLVDAAEVRAWVDSLRTTNPLPVPSARR